ncbi:hypothetical protein GCM10023314_30580 [Algibacter agarivorans]|uniref:Uncharacterized protein n=1 Tax=Algibacter agarivorans TaxID=1109741 RepID=A0ABP9GWF9_9FLAO
MVAVNESVRPTIKNKPFQLRGVKAINSFKPELDKCSWYCYTETTSHCKAYHVKFAKPYFKYIDPIYFGMIKILHSGNNYQFMNVVFLVILIPLLMFYLLVKSIKMHYQIKALKKTL